MAEAGDLDPQREVWEKLIDLEDNVADLAEEGHERRIIGSILGGVSIFCALLEWRLAIASPAIDKGDFAFIVACGASAGGSLFCFSSSRDLSAYGRANATVILDHRLQIMESDQAPVLGPPAPPEAE
jgi:hypothetical protein